MHLAFFHLFIFHSLIHYFMSVAGVSISAAVPAASAESPVLLRKGDVHSVVARVSSQRPGRGVPSGHLAVTWRRSRWAFPPRAPPAALGPV